MDEEDFCSRRSGGSGRVSSWGGCDGEAKVIDDGNAEVDEGVEEGAEERQARASKVLGFAGFLDLLGR